MFGRGPMMGRRRMPMDGLFILPALMFGGWIAIVAVGALLSLGGIVIGAVVEGLGALAEAAFSGSSLVIGIVIGLVAFHYFRNRKKEEAASPDHIGTVDGAEAGQVFEPEKGFRTNF